MLIRSHKVNDEANSQGDDSDSGKIQGDNVNENGDYDNDSIIQVLTEPEIVFIDGKLVYPWQLHRIQRSKEH